MKTEIVATISTQKQSPKYLYALVSNGATIFRLNTAHQTLEETKQLIAQIRLQALPVDIMIDTKGSEVRTTNRQPFVANTLHAYHFNCPSVYEQIQIGDHILIDDGEVDAYVEGKHNGTRYLEPAIILDRLVSIKPRRTVCVPGRNFGLPVVSEIDKQFFEIANEYEVEWIAHSFVNKLEDVEEVRKYLRESVKIMAKLETGRACENAYEISLRADAIMIARGDLALDVGYMEVPRLQEKIFIGGSNSPIYVATQFLTHASRNDGRPTRSEVQDVYTALKQGAAGLVLSNETTSGCGEKCVKFIHDFSMRMNREA